MHLDIGIVDAPRRWRRTWREMRPLPAASANPLPKEVWARRLSYTSYMATASRNRAMFAEVFDAPTHGAADLARLRRLPALRLLAIVEDWSPDVFHTLPTWARIVEELPDWELGIFARDTVPDLAEAFGPPGGRTPIPVYAFYLGERLQVWWAGRGAAAERALGDFLDGRSGAQLSPEEHRRGNLMLQEGYRTAFRRQNLDEILALLQAFFHLPAEA